APPGGCSRRPVVPGERFRRAVCSAFLRASRERQSGRPMRPGRRAMITIAEIALVPYGVLAWVMVGCLAGFLAEYLTRADYSVRLDMVGGVAGALVGGFLFSVIAPGPDAFAPTVLGAFFGACAFIVVLRGLAARPPRV